MVDQKRRQRQRSRSRGREQNSEKNCLYIGNIDRRITQEEFTNIFSEFGSLQYCYLVYEPQSDRYSKTESKVSRGYGFAKYKQLQEAKQAESKMNGKQLNGRKVNVEFSKRAKPRESTPGRYLGKTTDIQGKKKSPPRRSHHHRRDYSYSDDSQDYHRRRKQEKKKKHHRQRSRSRQHKKKHHHYRNDSYSR